MTASFKLAAVLLACSSGVPASDYSLFTASNKPTQPADHVRAFDVAISGMPAADRVGNIYLVGGGTFMGGAKVWKVGTDGMLMPFAGQGSGFLSPGDRMPAVLAGSLYVDAIAMDASGNVFLASGPNGFTRTSLYRVTPDGMIAIYLVTPTNWTAIDALSTDTAGNLYVLPVTGVSEITASMVVKIAPDLTMTTVSQMPATAMVSDEVGDLYLANRYTSQIVKVDTSGKVSQLAQMDSIARLALDGKGNLYVSQDNLATVEMVAPNGSITAVAGTGVSGYSGDGGPATQAELGQPTTLTVDPAGNLYIADSRLRRVDTNGIIHTAAGCACGGDGVPIAWVRTGFPLGVAVDAQGGVYYSDRATHIVRRIGTDGTATVVAGNGESGFSGDNGPARQARLAAPAGLALDSAGNLYIAEEQGNRIRRVSPDGTIRTVAGNGISAWSGDGGPATAASVAAPDGVAVDAAGNIYIADTATHRIRKVTADGIIHTIAGSDQYGLAGDGGPATQALLINPRMLALDRAGNLLIADSAAHVVRKITPAGIIQRVAGTGQAASGGDGGAATAAEVWSPWGIAVDAAGNILIGETGARHVRMVDHNGVISTLVSTSAYSLATDATGRIWFGGGTVGVASQTGPPFALPPLIYDGGFTNAAMPQTSAVAPGEIVSIYGAGLAPGTPVTGAVSAGVLQTEIGGVRVLFDGIPAPLLYVGSGVDTEGLTAGQINAVVPYEVAGKTTVTVMVEYQGMSSNPVTLDVVPAVPAIFLVPLAGVQPVLAATNQNGTRSGPGNPATAGSIISLYGTGAGEMNPPATDGRLTGSSLTSPQLRVSASIGSRMLGVTYAGDAPGFVSGALQVNVQLPDDLLTGYYYLELRVGNAISGTGTLFTIAKE